MDRYDAFKKAFISTSEQQTDSSRLLRNIDILASACKSADSLRKIVNLVLPKKPNTESDVVYGMYARKFLKHLQF